MFSSHAQQHPPLIATSSRVIALLLLSLSLLLKVVLDTALSGLALSVQLVVVGFALLVAGNVGNGTDNGALDAVADASTKVAELTLGLLLLALEVLLTAGVLQGLYHVC